MKKTLIIGASENPDRYAYMAAHKLVNYGHEIINVGLKPGEVAGQQIEKKGDLHSDIDTITMYIGAPRQAEYYDYILQTNPKRVIFNPGSENPELEMLLEQHDIEVLEACTLVMLSTGQY